MKELINKILGRKNVEVREPVAVGELEDFFDNLMSKDKGINTIEKVKQIGLDVITENLNEYISLCSEYNLPRCNSSYEFSEELNRYLN